MTFTESIHAVKISAKHILPSTMLVSGNLIDKFMCKCRYRSFPQIRPPFCNLSLSTKRRGGLCAGCDDFSRDYALPFRTGKAWLHCRWGVGAKREASPSARRRDAPDATGRLTSFSVEGWGSRALSRSSWRVHRWCGRFAFTVDTFTVDSRVA